MNYLLPVVVSLQVCFDAFGSFVMVLQFGCHTAGQVHLCKVGYIGFWRIYMIVHTASLKEAFVVCYMT